MILCWYFIWFIFYGIVGWEYESIIRSIEGRRFINSGFLHGPYCPVYGLGAIMDIIILGSIENIVLLFIFGAVLTSILEYITAWLLEELFHAKWWDYSNYRFQIQGRVCLLGALVFGVFSVVLIKIVHPHVAYMTNIISSKVIWIVALILFGIIVTDSILTIINMIEFNKKLQDTQSTINDFFKESMARANGIKKVIGENLKNNKVNEYIKMLVKRLNKQEKHLLIDFPRFKSTRYNEALQKIKNMMFKKE